MLALSINIRPLYRPIYLFIHLIYLFIFVVATLHYKSNHGSSDNVCCSLLEGPENWVTVRDFDLCILSVCWTITVIVWCLFSTTENTVL